MSAAPTISAACGECVLRTRATNLACVRCATERALVADVEQRPDERLSTNATRRDTSIAIVLLVITAACWGSAFRFTELALVELPPLEVTFLRCLIGAVVIGIASRFLHRSRSMSAHGHSTAPTRRAAWRALVVSGICTGIAYATIALGQVGATSTATGVILGTVPVWTAGFVLLSGRGSGGARRPPPSLIAALLLGSAAAAIPALADPAAAPAWAVALLAVAAISHGGSMAMIQPAIERFGPLRSTLGVNVLSVLLVSPWVLGTSDMNVPSAPVIAAVLVLGLLPTGLAYVAFFEVARRLGARRASLAVYLIPAVALVVGWLSDPRLVTIATLSGAACGIAAVTVGVRSGVRIARAPVPTSTPASTTGRVDRRAIS